MPSAVSDLRLKYGAFVGGVAGSRGTPHPELLGRMEERQRLGDLLPRPEKGTLA